MSETSGWRVLRTPRSRPFSAGLSGLYLQVWAHRLNGYIRSDTKSYRRLSGGFRGGSHEAPSLSRNHGHCASQVAARGQAGLGPLTLTPVGQADLPSGAWSLRRMRTATARYVSQVSPAGACPSPGGGQAERALHLEGSHLDCPTGWPCHSSHSGAQANTCDRCELRDTAV